MRLGPGTLFMGVMIFSILCHALYAAVKFCLAWYFAFHFVKRFKHLPAHMRPPGWPPTTS